MSRLHSVCRWVSAHPVKAIGTLWPLMIAAAVAGLTTLFWVLFAAAVAAGCVYGWRDGGRLLRAETTGAGTAVRGGRP